jgi:hypothetical protein
MKVKQSFVTLFFVFTLFAIINCGAQLSERTLPSSVLATNNESSQQSFLQTLLTNKVEAFGKWPGAGGEAPYYYLGTKNAETSDKAGPITFSILSKNGEVQFSEAVSEIEKVYEIWALRTTGSQLVLEANYGGSESFIQIFDFQQGKVIDLTKSIQPNNSFTLKAELRPTDLTDSQRASQPFQLMLTETVGGLPGPGESVTRVYRYKDGQYHYISEVSQRRIDMFIEKLLTSSSFGKKDK